MYIVIQHRIPDPSRFWELVEQDITKTAVDARLMQWRADSERGLCVSLWAATPGTPVRMQFNSAAYHVRAAVYPTMEEAITVGLPEHWSTEATAESNGRITGITQIVGPPPAADPSPPPHPAA